MKVQLNYQRILLATKWQKFKVEIPKGYKPIEREAIADDIISFIRDRTLQGKNKNNRDFTPGYSKGYADSREGQLAGKRKGATPNLKLTGDMLSALGDYMKHKSGEINIGFDKGTEDNAKADGNVRGTYGHKAPITNGRNFMGITNKDLKKILKGYPLKKTQSALVKKARSVAVNLASKTEAREYAEKLARQHDLDFETFVDLVFADLGNK